MKEFTAEEILAALPEDAEFHITIKQADLVRALAKLRGGPEYVSAKQAAETIGFSPGYWVQRARDGRIASAVRDGDGPWRLPLESCRAYLKSLGAARLSSADTGSRRPFVPRGPRKPYVAPPTELKRSEPRGPNRGRR